MTKAIYTNEPCQSSTSDDEASQLQRLRKIADDMTRGIIPTNAELQPLMWVAFNHDRPLHDFVEAAHKKLLLDAAASSSKEGKEEKKKPKGNPNTIPNANGCPKLVIHASDPTETARQLAGFIARHGDVLNNGNDPVHVVCEDDHMPKAVVLTAEYVRVLAHTICCPVKYTKEGEEYDAAVSTDIANLYLKGLEGLWGLRPFKGITSSPILGVDGSIRTANGYDVATGLWCHNVPEVNVPEHPTREDAEAALKLLRHTFRTFPFADAERKHDEDLKVDIVVAPANMDESTFLAGLMTSVCRQSLETAPGLLVNAPSYSGAGSGKGLLVKSCCIIASGCRPTAFNSGHDAAEFDKRLTSALIEARPCVFLDNFNAKNLQSDILASALTEPLMMVRVFGHSKNVPLFTTTLIAIAGNGVQIAEDMARRLLVCNLDAKMEDPEQRKFRSGFLDDVFEARPKLLSAALTIWRWGRQNAAELTRGRSLGNYEIWTNWVRDPLLTLGCKDPVERIAEIKANDPKRKVLVDIFDEWWLQHQGQVIKAAELHDDVKRLLDPTATTDEDGNLKASRQRITMWLQKHKGTRVGGYWLEEIRDLDRTRTHAFYRLHSSIMENTKGNGAKAFREPPTAANNNLQATGTDNGRPSFSKLYGAS